MDQLTQAISMVGFPIVAYGGMFWYMVQMNKDHREEVKLLSESLNNNTKVLVELKELLKKYEN